MHSLAKTLEKIGFLLFLLVGGLAIAAEHYGLPWLFSASLIGVGLIACLGGIRVIVKRKAYEGKVTGINPRYIKRFSGLSARLIGLGLLLAGPFIIVLGSVDLFRPGGASAFLREAVDSSYGLAILLGFAGLMATLFGIMRMRSGSGTTPPAWGRIGEFSFKIGGAWSTLLGVTLLVVAVGTIFSPGLPKQLVTEVYEQGARLGRSLMLDE